MSHPAFDTVANVAREIFVEHEAKGRSMKSPRIFPREAGPRGDGSTRGALSLAGSRLFGLCFWTTWEAVMKP
jgi:hypothetical protein